MSFAFQSVLLAAPSPDSVKTALIARARAEGFDAVGITRPDAIGEAGQHLGTFLGEAMHGEMAWLRQRRAPRRPAALWPEARSVIMLGMNYGPAEDPLAGCSRNAGAARSRSMRATATITT